MKDRHIVIISGNYPSTNKPYRGVFVRNLVREIARQGLKCSVISPGKLYKAKEPVEKYDDYISDNLIHEIRPRTISFSNKKIFMFNTYQLTIKLFENAVKRGLKKLNSPPDIFYGHFLYPHGSAAIKFANKYNCPSFVAVGESIPNRSFQRVSKAYKELYGSVNGIISVSNENKNFCINKLNISQKKIGVFPNGVNKKLFYPRNKTKMRKKYNLPEEKFLISFVGSFTNRKGVNRLIDSVKDIESVGLVLLGEGKLKHNINKIVFKGVVEHNKVPELLSATDAFVLPTLAEGSSNAIIEAMACGLPIISSNRDFNKDILDDKFSILIDPKNKNEIYSSIIELIINNDKRDKMSKFALKKSKEHTIKKRAKNIINFISKKM